MYISIDSFLYFESLQNISMFRTKEKQVVGRNMWVKGDGVCEMNKW
jgi:hypothetical protein